MSGRARRGGQGRGGQGPRSGGPRRGAGGQRGTTPLRDGARQDRPRGPGGDVVEGRHAVRELLLAGVRRVREVVIAAEMDPAPIVDEIRELALEAKVPVRELARSKFDAATVTEAAQGVMARAAPLPDLTLDDLLARGDDDVFLLVVDGVTDPGNLGAIIRTGDCAGVNGVVLPRHRSARVSPTVAKAAQGAIEYVPIATVGGIPAALKQLADRGVWTIGLDVVGDVEIYDVAVADGPVALVLGSEGRGLSRLARERCDVVASIPLHGALDSLNVGAAAAVASFEIARRRRAASSGR